MKYTKIKKILKETENHSNTETNQSAEATNQKPSLQKKPEDNDKLTNGNKQAKLTNGHGEAYSANQDEEDPANQEGEEIEVWGSQFDRKLSTGKEREKVPVQKKENNDYLQKLGSKMFQHSLRLKNNKVCSSGFSSQNVYDLKSLFLFCFFHDFPVS